MISTERLELRWPAHEDAEFFLRLLNERSFIDNIADRGVRTIGDAKLYIDKLLVQFQKYNHGFFLVTDKSGTRIGMCGIIRRENLPDPDVGFAFLPEYTGKGYAYEAARAVMERGMKEWGIRRISAIVSPTNFRSINLLKKLGLVYEKNLRLAPDDHEVQYFVRDKDKVSFAHNRFQAILQQSAIAIQIYNTQGACVEVNDAWETLFGSKKSELDGYNVLEDPQIHATGVIDFFRRAFAGEMVHVPGTFYDPAKSGKKGRARWLESIFTPIMNDAGVVKEVAILFTDITDLKLAQEEVARSRDHMKAIFDHLPEGLIVQDENFRLIYANPTAVKMSGHKSYEEWVSKFPHSTNYHYLRPDGTEFPLDKLPNRRAMNGEKDIPEVQLLVKHKETGLETYSAVSAAAITDDKGKPFQVVSVFRDITDKMRIETQLRDAIEARNLFFSVASHELRTPITAMKLNAQLMHLTYPNVSLESLSKLDRQLVKLSKLVDEMLDISRLSRGKLELRKKPVDLASLTRDVLQDFSDQLRLASIPLTLDLAGAVTGLWDPDRLEQVVENLVTNAIRYARKSPLFVKVSEAGDSAILEVCDQGPGIPEEDHEKIFNRFERSRSFGERSGMGLGLYIVKEIVTLHGGTVSVSNLNTGGARFLIELPRERS